MIGYTRPWPQSIWLAVVCAREWFVPECAPVSGAKGFPISFFYFPGRSPLVDFLWDPDSFLLSGLIFTSLSLIVFPFKFWGTEYFLVRKFHGHCQLFCQKSWPPKTQSMFILNEYLMTNSLFTSIGSDYNITNLFKTHKNYLLMFKKKSF